MEIIIEMVNLLEIIIEIVNFLELTSQQEGIMEV